MSCLHASWRKSMLARVWSLVKQTGRHVVCDHHLWRCEELGSEPLITAPVKVSEAGMNAADKGSLFCIGIRMYAPDVRSRQQTSVKWFSFIRSRSVCLRCVNQLHSIIFYKHGPLFHSHILLFACEPRLIRWWHQAAGLKHSLKLLWVLNMLQMSPRAERFQVKINWVTSWALTDKWVNSALAGGV